MLIGVGVHPLAIGLTLRSIEHTVSINLGIAGGTREDGDLIMHTNKAWGLSKGSSL